VSRRVGAETDLMKVLISACLLGENVRWNGQNKYAKKLLEWADSQDLELVPICPEDELLGTPRGKISLIQIEDNLCANYKGSDIASDLKQKCEEINDRHTDAAGFIGIYGSPSCGISAGVKNLGKTIKGFMHQSVECPSTESSALKNENNREIFLKRMKKHER
jgi:uncharacterized protein YbbK (DUF523 family)